MKFSDRYRITIEDESHLTEIASGHFTRPALLVLGFLFLFVCLFISGLLIAFTPLRTLLPGYLKESQRSATEESLLRLDSLIESNTANRAYIDNFIRVTDIEREPGDSAAVVPTSVGQSSDSLSGATNREQHFVSEMEERERFNLSVLAPLAADGVLFSPVAGDGVFLKGTRQSEQPTILLPSDQGVQCSADGTVISLYHSGPEGYNITVQHNRGFVTYYIGVGTPLVGIGDKVNGGQNIALSPTPDAAGRRCFAVRMWHNGMALLPYEYLEAPTREQIPATPYEAPRGKF